MVWCKLLLAVFSATPILWSFAMMSERCDFRFVLDHSVEYGEPKLFQVHPVDSFRTHSLPRQRPPLDQVHLPLELGNQLFAKSGAPFFVKGNRVEIVGLGFRKKPITQRNRPAPLSPLLRPRSISIRSARYDRGFPAPTVLRTPNRPCFRGYPEVDWQEPRGPLRRARVPEIQVQRYP